MGICRIVTRQMQVWHYDVAEAAQRIGRRVRDDGRAAWQRPAIGFNAFVATT
jgi:hypothetical protein